MNAGNPYFVIDADLVESNLRILKGIMDKTGCRILMAQKCFSCYALYPLIAKYLSGATSSGLFEARLCHEEMPGAENHVFSPAYKEEDIDQLIGLCDHIVFNSRKQLALYGPKVKKHGLQVGLRINPECSTQKGHPIYDPCAPGSRLGVRLADFEKFDEDERLLLDGLHFHTLCEQNSDDLETTLNMVEQKFGKYLPDMRWINFGGGHHITRSDYDIQRLEECIMRMRTHYGLQVYLEPGEAVALNAGELHCNILDVQPKGDDEISNVILSTSAACHMPDVIEMPYTPPVMNRGITVHDGNNITSQYVYRFGGSTCLSGDVIGLYQSDHELHEEEEIVFGDMAIYSMVKTNTFNGMPLPDIYIRRGSSLKEWKRFSYDDFKRRV